MKITRNEAITFNSFTKIISAIDTLQVTIKEQDIRHTKQIKGIEFIKRTKSGNYVFKLNPNSFMLSYSITNICFIYQRSMQELAIRNMLSLLITDNANINDIIITRVDIKFDMYNLDFNKNIDLLQAAALTTTSALNKRAIEARASKKQDIENITDNITNITVFNQYKQLEIYDKKRQLKDKNKINYLGIDTRYEIRFNKRSYNINNLFINLNNNCIDFINSSMNNYDLAVKTRYSKFADLEFKSRYAINELLKDFDSPIFTDVLELIINNNLITKDKKKSLYNHKLRHRTIDKLFLQEFYSNLTTCLNNYMNS